MAEEMAIAIAEGADGSSKMTTQGTLTDRDVPEIQAFIKQHYREMFAKWSERSGHGYYRQPND